jgi:hypothetical protein
MPVEALGFGEKETRVDLLRDFDSISNCSLLVYFWIEACYLMIFPCSFSYILKVICGSLLGIEFFGLGF